MSTLIASDLDHTMVQHAPTDTSHARQRAFNRAWLSQKKAQTQQSLLVYSTGRSPELFKQLWSEAPLITPDVLICSVGSEIFYNTASPVPATLLRASQPQHHTTSLTDNGNGNVILLPPPAQPGMPQGPTFLPDGSWEALLDKGWDRAKAHALVQQQFPMLKSQASTEQRPHKISYSLDPDSLPGGKTEAAQLMEQMQKMLKENGVSAKVIYSGGRDVDVLSEAAGKGRGLAFLLQRLKEVGCAPENVQVAGDSGNDIELFQVPGVKGCVVSNAHPELRAFAEAQVAKGDADHIFQATEPCAGGILQAMCHFGFLPAPQTETVSSTALQHAANVASDTQTAHAAQQQATEWSHLSGEVGAREFAWRLGTAMAQALSEGIASPDDLIHHSALRLLVTNDCSLVMYPPAGSADSMKSTKNAQQPLTSTVRGGAANTAAAHEVQQDMQASCVSDASELCEASKAWIDELSAVQVVSLSRDAGEPEGGSNKRKRDVEQDEALAVSGRVDGADGHASGAWQLRFKVYCLSPAGTRGETVHELDAIVHQQTQPVPHGFLAKSVRVYGPFEMESCVPDITHAKFTVG